MRPVIDLLLAIPQPTGPGGSARKWELPPVLRRLTTAVVIWVSLLGVAIPAFGCSLIASKGDCCPAGASLPCPSGEGFTQPPDAMAACCSSGHASPSVVAIDSGRALYERDHHPNSSPDPFVLVAWPTFWSAAVFNPPARASLIRLPRSDAALTYLHTARLRL